MRHSFFSQVENLPDIDRQIAFVKECRQRSTNGNPTFDSDMIFAIEQSLLAAKVMNQTATGIDRKRNTWLADFFTECMLFRSSDPLDKIAGTVLWITIGVLVFVVMNLIMSL